MAVTMLVNGQKLDLSVSPDLLLEFLVMLTNMEERMNSIDKRLYNLEKNKSINPYLIKKRQRR